MKVLAIETSCDETGAAVLELKDSKVKILSNLLATSSDLHAKTGGIIPENAAREQVHFIMPLIIEALLIAEENPIKSRKENFTLAKNILKEKIDAIAVTYGPGLIGSLLVGVETAKTLSFAFNKPLIPVNHLLGHVFSNFADKNLNEIEFPAIALIVSGGHTDLLYFENIHKYKWLGGTYDDAAGEAMDKIGRLLGLAYPAGAEIEMRAKKAKDKKLRFTSPVINSDDLNFSFSGLKAEVSRFISSNNIDEELKNEVCAATQKAIIDVLVKKTVRAVKLYKAPTILLGGGVSANQKLRKQLENEIKNLQLHVKLFAPTKDLCTDNAAMIGAYGLLAGSTSPWEKIEAKPDLYFAST